MLGLLLAVIESITSDPSTIFTELTILGQERAIAHTSFTGRRRRDQNHAELENNV